MQELDPTRDLQRALLPINHESRQRRIDDEAALSYVLNRERPNTRRNRTQ